MEASTTASIRACCGIVMWSNLPRAHSSAVYRKSIREIEIIQKTIQVCRKIDNMVRLADCLNNRYFFTLYNDFISQYIRKKAISFYVFGRILFGNSKSSEMGKKRKVGLAGIACISDKMIFT